MKCGTIRDGSRDGAMVLVSDDLASSVRVAQVAPTLQKALENWTQCEPELREIWARLNTGTHPDADRFDPSEAMAPFPRSYQWLDASAYVNHIELMRRARGLETPKAYWDVPVMYQGGSDSFLGPYDEIVLPRESDEVDFEAELAIVTDDVPMGVSAQDALGHVKLVMLLNDVSLRAVQAREAKTAFGFLQSKPPTAFAPVAVTPDALGDAWSGGEAALDIQSTLRGKLFGRPNAGQEMTFNFGRLIQHAAETRPLGAGTIIGAGTVSNRGADKGVGRSVSEGGKGYSCIGEMRMVEKLTRGGPQTPFMRDGDRIRIEALDEGGGSVFGAIDQVLRIA